MSTRNGFCCAKGCQYSAPSNSVYCEVDHFAADGIKKHGANVTQVGGSHYKGKPIQPWDFIVQNEIPFLEGCAIKHISRHREKNGRQDLEKAIHYLQKAIEVYYPKEDQNK